MALWRSRARKTDRLAVCKTLAIKIGTRMQPFEYRSVRYWSKEINGTRTGGRKRKFFNSLCGGRQIRGRSLQGHPSPCQLSRLSRPRAVACSRGLSSPRVALVPRDAANVGRAVGDRRLQSVRVGSRAGVRLGEENERVESSGARRNLRSTPVRRGLRGRRLDGRAPDAEKLFWARNPSVKPARRCTARCAAAPARPGRAGFRDKLLTQDLRL